MAQTNNASPTGIANANQNAIDHANVNGVGAAPVPETATWVAMATLVGAAGFARWRRKSAKSA